MKRIIFGALVALLTSTAAHADYTLRFNDGSSVGAHCDNSIYGTSCRTWTNGPRGPEKVPEGFFNTNTDPHWADKCRSCTNLTPDAPPARPRSLAE